MPNISVAVVLQAFPKRSETFILDQIESLHDHGIDVQIISMQRGDMNMDISTLREKTVWTNLNPSRLSSVVDLLRLIIRRRSIRPLFALTKQYPLATIRLANTISKTTDFDLIHCHYGPVGLIAVQVRNLKLGISSVTPIVTTFHGYDTTKAVHPDLKALYEELFASGDLLLVNNTLMRSRLVRLGAPGERTFIQRNPIDTKRFSPTIAESTASKVRCASVGRFVEKKGLLYGIRAISNLIKEGMNVEYVLYGSGPLESLLRQEAESLGISDHVRFAGWLKHEDLPAALNATDILIAPSIVAKSGDREGIPTVILEAMASALPVVATHHEGIAEAVTHEVTGFLVPEKDPVALSQAIRKLSDNSLRERFGKAGRARVLQEFDRDRVTSELITKYRSVLLY